MAHRDDGNARDRLEPFVATLIHLLGLAAQLWRRGRVFDKRGWRWIRPRLVRLGGVTLAVVGALVEFVASAVSRLGARLPTVLGAVESPLVRGLAVFAAGVARATGATTAQLARALVHIMASLSPRLCRTRPVLLRVGVGLGGLAVLVWMSIGPLLHLAALPLQTSLDNGGLPPLNERSTVIANDGSILAVLHDEVDRRVVALDQIPSHVRHAVLSAEDRRFREHDGYDVEAIVRAFVANARAGEVTQGGSTITQQLAKQNLVGNERTVVRKVKELVHAVALEQHLSKDELLERYLNQVYFGSGAYGIAAAAEEFFAVPVEALRPEQSALLAGLIRSPGSFDPREDPEQATARRNEVLAVMADEGWLDPALAEQLRLQPLSLAPPGDRRPLEPHVVAAVKAEFLANPAFGRARKEREERLLGGGLEVHVTVNPGLQELARKAVQHHLRSGEGPTAAIAAVEPSTGRILALHGGEDFGRRQFNLATQGRRQPGSAFKPFVAAAALEAGLDPHQQLVGDGPVVFDYGGVKPWTVDNFEERDHGEVDLDEALTNSVNTALAQVAVGVGTERIVDVVGRVGIDVEAALGKPGQRGPAIGLGGLYRGVTPVEMASAYATLATGGRRPEPFLVERVLDRDGDVVFEREPSVTPALDPATSGVLVSALQRVVADGTGTAADVADWQEAGKTGTTQNNADAWFVGTVPVLSTAVWVGHPDGQTPVPGLTGGSVPAQVWHDFMSGTLADVAPVDFAPTARLASREGDLLDLPEPQEPEDGHSH